MSSPEWKLPLNLAIAFHVLIALAVVYLPHLLNSKPKFEDIYTVNLINIADVAPPAEAPPAPKAPAKPEPAPAPAPPKPIAKTPVKKVVEKAIALDEPEIAEPTPVTPPAPPEAISIKPSKRKVKAEVVEPPPPQPPEEKKVEKKVEKKDFSKSRRQQLAEMIRAEQKAAEEASILAEEAEIEKRLAEAALNRARAEAASMPSTSTAQSSSSAASQPSSNQLSALENRYYAAIIARLQAIWALPEYKEWDPSLTATVVITVQKNGDIADSFFEVQSGDKIFDRFVTKALQDVGQLPPIPGALKLERKEIGLKFTPGRIQ